MKVIGHHCVDQECLLFGLTGKFRISIRVNILVSPKYDNKPIRYFDPLLYYFASQLATMRFNIGIHI